MKTVAWNIACILLGVAGWVVPAAAADNLDFLKDHTDFKNIGRMLPDYCRRLAFEQLDVRRQRAAAWSAEDVVRRRESVRDAIRKAVGAFPERTPLNARVTGTLDRGDYRIEKIVFESQPGFYVTANLYVPQTGRPPYPAILFPLGHEEGGKAHEAWQRMLATFARRGYVALAWDPLGQGERVQLWDDDLRGSKAGASTTEHTILGAQTLLVGDALARYTIWDGIRALNYLLSRPEVDARRVGVTGNSGGGTHTAYLAALEDRLAAAAPSCYITSWRRILETIGPQDAEQCFPGWLAGGMDFPDLVEAFAPRPYLVLSAIRDFFSIAGARATFAEAQSKWSDAERIAKVEVDDGHGYNLERRLAAYRWFDRWLKGSEAPAGEPETRIATEDELFCTRTGQVNTALGGETVFTLNLRRARGLTRTGADGETIRRLTGFEASRTPLDPEPYGSVRRTHYRIDRLTFQSEPGIVIPALLYVPEGHSGRGAAVVLVDGRGKSAADGDAASFAGAGYVVLSIDARGFGETRNAEGDRGWARYFGDYDSAMTAILTGRTLTGMRALDVIRAVDLLAARADVDPGRISAVGYGAGATALLHAAVLDGRIRAVGLERMLVSYESVVESRMNRGIFEQIIPGVLKAYDLPDLVARMAPRRVWIADAEDPMQALVPLDEVRREYRGGQAELLRREPDAAAAGVYRFDAKP